MERTLTQAQLNEFRQWLRTLNMNSLMKVAEVLEDVLGEREDHRREQAALRLHQWQFVDPEHEPERPSDSAASSSQHRPEAS